MVLKRAFGVALGWLLLAGTAGAIAPRTIEGELTADDPKAGDGTHFDIYEFQGSAGEEVAIELESEEFDARLVLMFYQGEQLELIGRNDDGGSLQNSLLAMELPADGTYVVVANTAKAGERGQYRLTWRNATERDRQRDEPSQHDQTRMFAIFLNEEGFKLYSQGQWSEALRHFQTALWIVRGVDDRANEGTTLYNIGSVYRRQGQYDLALEQFQQALVIVREVHNRAVEGATLSSIGLVYHSQGRYGEALEQFQQALVIVREVHNRAVEGATLNNIGLVYDSQGQYDLALEQYQQAITIFREIADRAGEGTTLNNVGTVYLSQGQYDLALEQYQQAMTIFREIADRAGEGTTLNNIGEVYANQGQYSEALEQYKQALVIIREVGDRAGEGTTLNNIGGVYRSQGQYGLALEQYQQALAIRREVGDRAGEGATLNNIGAVYQLQGQYGLALEQYQQALAIAREVGDHASEGATLNNIGAVYQLQGQYGLALEQYQQALAIRREVGDRAGEGATLNNIGAVYQLQGQYGLALEQYQQALAIAREVGDRPLEGRTLNNIGTVHKSQGRYGEASEQYQQALAILQEIGDRAGEGGTLNNIGYAIEETVGSAAAVPFFKNAVEVYETIRADQRTTPLEHQQSYTETVADTYRKLADLLIAQGRIPEAERVLDLLALQEIASYTQGSRATVDELGRLEYTAAETAILQQHNSIIEFGQKLQRCDVAASTTQDCQTLRRQYAQLQEEFRRVVATVMQDAIRPDDSNPQNPADLRSGAQALLEQQERTIVIQTILRRPSETDDNRGRLVLLWTVPGEVANYREVILPDTFSRTVFEFRQAINRQRDPDPAKTRQLAQQLYDWIVRPLQDELDRNQIEHLIFRLDRELRYLPIAALHDGNQYLIERYSVANFITLGDIDPTARLGPRDASNILALGRTEAYANFPALPHVKTELDAIVQEAQRPDPNGGLFRGSSYLDRDFTADRLSLLTGRNILHVATHGEFNPTNTVNSYFLLGTGGDKFDLDAIENMRGLGDIHLAVLSACETGLSGDPENLARRGANGFEINSLAYAFTRLGRAKAVIASLWRVHDRSTSLLMQDFYQRLAANPALTKATALQQSQIAFLRGELTQPNDLDPDADPSHPYHWAPFVLTGNSW